MTTITLNVLQDRALEVIRYLQEVKDVEIVNREESDSSQTTTRKTWAGAIKNPSKELLEYADKVRGEWDHRI